MYPPYFELLKLFIISILIILIISIVVIWKDSLCSYDNKAREQQFIERCLKYGGHVYEEITGVRYCQDYQPKLIK